MGTRGEKESYPAGIGVEKPPPDTVFDNFLHSPTSVEENSKHALSLVNYTSIFLGLCWLRSVIRHGMLLWDWRNHQGWMQVDKSRSERTELGISPRDLYILDHGQLEFSEHRKKPTPVRIR